MSLATYAAHLRPSDTLRKLVLASGGLFCLTGLWLVGGWPLDNTWKSVIMFAWTGHCIVELVRYWRAYMRFSHIRIESGGAVILDGAAHATTDAEMLPGSVLLGRVGWLRLKTSDGRRFAELVAGNSRKNKEWRRLQVIWRHL